MNDSCSYLQKVWDFNFHSCAAPLFTSWIAEYIMGEVKWIGSVISHDLLILHWEIYFFLEVESLVILDHT